MALDPGQELTGSGPELLEPRDEPDVGFIAPDPLQVAKKMREPGGLEQGQRLAVDLEDPDGRQTAAEAIRLVEQMLAQRRDTLPAPGVEHGLERAEILQPERDRRGVEQLRLPAIATSARFSSPSGSMEGLRVGSETGRRARISRSETPNCKPVDFIMR